MAFNEQGWRARDLNCLSDRQLRFLHSCSDCGSYDVRLVLYGDSYISYLEYRVSPFEPKWIICNGCGKERHGLASHSHDHNYDPGVLDLVPNVCEDQDKWGEYVEDARRILGFA